MGPCREAVPQRKCLWKQLKKKEELLGEVESLNLRDSQASGNVACSQRHPMGKENEGILGLETG